MFWYLIIIFIRKLRKSSVWAIILNNRSKWLHSCFAGVAGLSVAIRIAVLPEKASCAPNLRETLLRIAWCGWLEFVLGKISILLITCLALERWFAVVKPIQYRYNFSKKRLYLYLILILLTASLSKLQELLPNYDPQTLTSRVFVITEVALTCLLPLFITWFTYAHIWYHSRKSPAIQRTGGGKGKEKLLRMCAITALFITIFWVPSDINYVIINVINNRETLSIFSAFDMIAMSNSMINPWVYYFTNREYKNEFKKLFNNLLAVFRIR